MSDIKIYTANWCPYCKLAKRYFDEEGQSYEEINIESEGMSREQLRELTGGTTVPQIIIDGKTIGGYDQLMELASAGELALK